jgi:hypothetical protein
MYKDLDEYELREVLDFYKEYMNALSEINKKIKSVMVSKKDYDLKELKATVDFFDYDLYLAENQYYEGNGRNAEIYKNLDVNESKIFMRAIFEEMKNIREDYIKIIKELDLFLDNKIELSDELERMIF